MKHIIPDDTYSHIESETCWCNPRISGSEGETYYIHNSNYENDSRISDREIVNILNVRSNKYKLDY